MSDKEHQKGQADRMAFDVSKAALPALWKSDPGFVELAKHLYGDDVTLEDVAKDLFGKMDPGPADTHVNQPLKRGKKAMTIRPQDDEESVEETSKSLEIIGKSFVTLVEKAYDAGLIDSEGNLNEEEIAKSQQYVRDHAGRFASQGKHTGKMVAGLAAAGALAGSGAVLGAKAPKAMKYAGESIRFVGQHLKSADPVERHVARSLLPHALKATGKAVGTAGLSATTGAGGVYEGTRTYQNMRDHAVARKRLGSQRGDAGSGADVRKDWSKFDAKRKGETAVGLAATAGAAEGAGQGSRKVQQAASRKDINHMNMYDDLAHASNQYAEESGSIHALRQGTDFERESAKHAASAARHVVRGRKLFRSGRNAAIGLGAAATVAGVSALEEHDRKKYAKRDDTHDVTWEGDFSKVDEDKRQVFGWASVTEMDGKPVVDLQGDYIHPDDVEKAAYDYVLTSRVGGDMHSRVDEYGNVIEKADRPLHVSDLIESVVFTPEKCEAMGISKNLSGRWWTGFQINDPDVWSDVKSGRRTGFSIHGAGMRKNIDISELDPESELIGKAYQESDNLNEFIDNLCTLEEVTGSTEFGDLAKHLAHGIDVPQVNAQQSRNAGVFGSMGSGVGGLAGGAIGAKMGHVGEGAAIGATVGGLTGTAAGVHHGRERPQRPPSVHAAMGSFGKAVDNTNRLGGLPTSRQGFYQQYALQQATDMLAPQVAQHIQTMQEQRWQQQMIEQQMLQQQAQQTPQDFSVRMGPYANHSQGQQQTPNPLTPSQQTPNTGASPSSTPTSYQPMAAS